jgi:hypothetical protein
MLADRRTEDEMFAAARSGTANVDAVDGTSDDADVTSELVLATTPGGGS